MGLQAFYWPDVDPGEFATPRHYCMNTQPNRMDRACRAGQAVCLSLFSREACCDKLAAPGTVMIAVMQADLVHRHRLTVEEYFRMADVGLLAPDARVELIEGEVIDMAPTGPQHGGLTGDLVLRIGRDLGDQVCVWVQTTLPLGKSSAPEPDIALLKYRKDRYKTRYPSPDEVLLVIEVSQSSLRHDREVKLPLYARHNLPEVWLIDVERRHIHFFHTPRAEHYTHASSTPSPARVSLQALPGVALDLTGLLEDLEGGPRSG